MQECHQRKQEILGCEQLMENMWFYGPGVFPGSFPPIVRTRAPLGGVFSGLFGLGLFFGQVAAFWSFHLMHSIAHMLVADVSVLFFFSFVVVFWCLLPPSSSSSPSSSSWFYSFSPSSSSTSSFSPSCSSSSSSSPGCCGCSFVCRVRVVAVATLVAVVAVVALATVATRWQLRPLVLSCCWSA